MAKVAAYTGHEIDTWSKEEKKSHYPHCVFLVALSSTQITFIIFNTFCKLILNLTLFFSSSKLTLLAASISLARRNVCAAPCMVAWREG